MLIDGHDPLMMIVMMMVIDCDVAGFDILLFCTTQTA